MKTVFKPFLAAAGAAFAVALTALPVGAVAPDPHGPPATCCPLPAATAVPAPAPTVAPVVPAAPPAAQPAVAPAAPTGAVLAATATAPGPALANTGGSIELLVLGLGLLALGVVLLAVRRSGSRLAWNGGRS